MKKMVRVFFVVTFMVMFNMSSVVAMKRAIYTSPEVMKSCKRIKIISTEMIAYDLLYSLDTHRFGVAKKIIGQHPHLLGNPNSQEHARLIDGIHNKFAQNFFESDYYSHDYQVFIKHFVHDGFDLDRCSQEGIPLLCLVIQDNNDKYLDLLKGGALVNIQDSQGNTPLGYAAQLGYEHKISKLLLYGAVVNRSISCMIPSYHHMRRLILSTFKQQQCFDCKSHQDDLSSIPCVNRHLGNFICKVCYDWRCREMKRCPCCARSMGKFDC